MLGHPHASPTPARSCFWRIRTAASGTAPPSPRARPHQPRLPHAPARPLSASGRHCGPACPRAGCRSHGLGSDRATLWRACGTWNRTRSSSSTTRWRFRGRKVPPKVWRGSRRWRRRSPAISITTRFAAICWERLGARKEAHAAYARSLDLAPRRCGGRTGPALYGSAGRADTARQPALTSGDRRRNSRD